jgi:CBS domain-containing protein
MQIQEIMTNEPTRIAITASTQEAAEIVSRTQVSDLMVVDDQGCFMGVLSEGDLIRAVLPNFDDIMASGGSLREAFDLFVEGGRTLANGCIESIMIPRDKIVAVHPDEHVLKAAGPMISRQIRRLPVVDKAGKLIGTVSRADVCRGVLRA